MSIIEKIREKIRAGKYKHYFKTASFPVVVVDTNMEKAANMSFNQYKGFEKAREAASRLFFNLHGDKNVVVLDARDHYKILVDVLMEICPDRYEDWESEYSEYENEYDEDYSENEDYNHDLITDF